MALNIIQNGAFAEQKTVAATISIHTHTHTSPTLPKTPRISATIKSKFSFKYIFSDIVYNVQKIDFAKNRAASPLDPPLSLSQLPSKSRRQYERNALILHTPISMDLAQ